jgi:hypothetical protein
VVRDSDRGEDTLDDGGDGGVGVALNMGRSTDTDEGVGWDVESVGSGQANQEYGDLKWGYILA